MSEFTELMRRRHTVRSYAPTAVEAEKLSAVLEAGRWAPTAVNAQPQRIVVLDTAENLEKVRQFCTFGWKKRYVDLAKESDTAEHDHIVIYYGAPVVLLVCYDRTACWTHPESGESSGATDATIVATHMMLEATAQGLASAWISYFDRDKARELLSIPEEWEISSMLYLGYPAEDEAPAKISGTRKSLSETCFHNSAQLGEGKAMRQTMRALSISDITPASEARMTEVPIPAVKPGWVLVRVRGIGMNHSEWELRHDEIRESYISHPIIPGIEGVGEVVDPSDQPFVAGQKVCMLMGGMGRMWDGSYAEYCLVRADHLFAIPEVACELPWATLAAVPETFFTAWGSLFECLRLTADDVLMIRGASCGLGYAAIQIAKAQGAHVIATTHREKYFELLKEFGADELVLDDANLAAADVKADKVLELIGPKTLRDSLGCLNKGGICCDTGILGGQFVLDGFDPIKGIPNGCYLTGFFSNFPTQQVMEDIFTFIAKHHIEPFVAQVFDFEHLLDALAMQDAGGFQGKLVVVNES